MFKLKKLHKYAGITSGFVLFLLALSGFFLNHDYWKFLYTTTIPNTYLPQSTINHDKKLINAYRINKENTQQHIVCSFRGIYQSLDGGMHFTQRLDTPCLNLVNDHNEVYAATTEGIFYSKDYGKHWQLFVLADEVVTDLSLDTEILFAVIEKREVVSISRGGEILVRTKVKIADEALLKDITLGRLVRDLHYGRGIFDEGWSLLWNDYATIWLFLLSLSGYLLWFLIRSIKKKKHYKKPLGFFLKLHSSSLVWIALIPLIILSITGIFLDHSKLFASFLHKTSISNTFLPPIYRTLNEDIWSVDLHKGIYRIGNRYGVYRSSDLQDWIFESKGFAYRIMHENDEVYVSGMGAPNRKYTQNGWRILPDSPHMFKSMLTLNGQIHYFSSMTDTLPLPQWNNTTLYSFLLSIHDGSFFAPWWVYINDIASILLLVLLYTGLQLWYKRIRRIFPSLKP